MTRAAGWPPIGARVLAGLLALGPAAAAAQAAAGDCAQALGGPAREVAGEGLVVAWRAVPHPLPLDRPVVLELRVCGRPADALRVDADMPAHRHGMNYRPTVENLGNGRHVARGLLFHMAGRWRLIFDIDTGGRRLRLTDELELR